MGSLEERVATLEMELAQLRQQLNLNGSAPVPFSVVDEEGRTLLSVRRTERGAELTLYDAVGERVAVIGQAPSGGNGIAIYNSAGRRVAGIFADREGGNLAVYNHDGLGVAGIQAGSEGALLNMRDTTGLNRVSLLATAEGAVAGLFEGGVPVLTLPERPEG